jgi:Protein of unknown function (DUF664)
MDPDTAALLASLDSQRNHVLGILDGLPDEALRRPVLPSGWTCLGMVQHLTVSDERFWFQGIVAGKPVELTLTDELYQAAWQVDPVVPTATVFAAYRTEIERSNEIIASTSLDTPPAFWPEDLWPDWRLADLRAVLLHVITETACHAGHLDAARELIDGRRWLD